VTCDPSSFYWNTCCRIPHGTRKEVKMFEKNTFINIIKEQFVRTEKINYDYGAFTGSEII